MIQIDCHRADSFVDNKQLEDARSKASEAFHLIQQERGQGSDWLGWRRILSEPDEDLLRHLEQRGEQVGGDADILIVCGIGGSYLGTRAVLEALINKRPDTSPNVLYAGHHMGGAYLQRLIRTLERPLSGGRKPSVYMNVISKSGTTLETALSFRVLRRWMEKTYGDEASGRILVTTAPEGGVLNRMSEQKGYERFQIPDDVGGRFSVLTPVGLLPLAIAGVNIRKLVEGARASYQAYESDPEPLLSYAALRYLFHEQGKMIDLIGSFEPELDAFSGWIQQLLGESEGKGGHGIFPARVRYSTDLHSIGQMVQEGRRNLVETLLVIEQNTSSLDIGRGDPDLDDGLEYLDGRTFHDINREALNGTVEAHQKGEVPLFRICLKALNETCLGELIYSYELLTAIYVYMLDVNPFDQPGVEAYKKAMFRNLGKE